MISAGNDIVSLTATNVIRTKSPAFYSKIVSPAENTLFDTLDQEVLPFDRFVWLLWSVKESAYKYLHRLDPAIVFTPVKFEVGSIEIPAGYSHEEYTGNEITGLGFNGVVTFNSIVVFAGKKLFSRTIINKAFIASFVNTDDNFAIVHWGIKRIEDTSYKYQSDAVRKFVMDKLNVVSNLNELTIEKDKDEIPVLLKNGEQLEVPLSLSHHERWIAFSFQLF